MSEQNDLAESLPENDNVKPVALSIYDDRAQIIFGSLLGNF